MTGTTSQLQPADGGLGAELSYDEQIERWEIAVRTAFEQGGEPRFIEDINRFDLPVSASTMISASISLVLACAAFHELDGPKLSDFLARQALSDQTSQETSYRLLFQFHDGEVGVVVADRGLCLLDLAELYDISLQGTGSIGFMGFWVVRPDGKDLDPSEIVDLERAITCDIYFDYCDEEVCIDFDESWPGALFCPVRDCCG
jgi:hypothetical protein